jgi:hypothetical protein
MRGSGGTRSRTGSRLRGGEHRDQARWEPGPAATKARWLRNQGAINISSITGVVPGSGEIERDQFWYRDPGGHCGSNFNLSNGHEITW